MGLQVAPLNSEELFMHRRKHGAPPAEAHFVIGDTSVRVGANSNILVYLDAVLASTLSACPPGRSRWLSAWADSNLGGPDSRVRRLYANTVRVVTLYGSPVWADVLVAKSRSLMLLRRVFQRVAIKIVRGYRTVCNSTWRPH
ncbi:hypothetical protein ACFW04_000215 [Cataglyphis niger]